MTSVVAVVRVGNSQIPLGPISLWSRVGSDTEPQLQALFVELDKPHPSGFGLRFVAGGDSWTESRFFETAIYLLEMSDGDHRALVTWRTETPGDEVEQRHVRQVLAAWERVFGPPEVLSLDEAEALQNGRVIAP